MIDYYMINLFNFYFEENIDFRLFISTVEPRYNEVGYNKILL